MYRDSETGVVVHHGVVMRSPVVPRILQVVHFLFGVLYLLLGTRFVLEYIQAHAVAFVRAIDTWSDVFYRPFRGIVANGSDGAGHPIVWSLVIAIVAYAILHGLVAGLLRAIGRPRDELVD